MSSFWHTRYASSQSLSTEQAPCSSSGSQFFMKTPVTWYPAEGRRGSACARSFQQSGAVVISVRTLPALTQGPPRPARTSAPQQQRGHSAVHAARHGAGHAPPRRQHRPSEARSGPPPARPFRQRRPHGRTGRGRACLQPLFKGTPTAKTYFFSINFNE